MDLADGRVVIGALDCVDDSLNIVLSQVQVIRSIQLPNGMGPGNIVIAIVNLSLFVCVFVCFFITVF